VQVGQRVGKKEFYKYVKAFGFGEDTEIKLPGEAGGLVYDYEDIGPVELATMSFGHGISVTPIQLVTAASAVANDGLLLQPRLVDRIEDENGIKKLDSKLIRRVISKETAQTLRELLAGVVANGSGKKAQVKGYRIGGKTGTAQHYGIKAYDSSFIGMLPVDNPELVVLVLMKGVTSYPYYGSQLAAPMFHNVVKDTLRYLEIPPEEKEDKMESEDVPEVTVPNVINHSFSEVELKLRNLGLNFKLEGDRNKIVDQIPKAGAKVKLGTTVILFASDGIESKKRYRVTVPGLEGMKLDKAQDLLAELGLKLDWQGNGKITFQKPAPGFRVDSGTTIEVRLN
jgi:stage V sporulation protein D (sporulation-specific penicillin-binding protein)